MESILEIPVTVQGMMASFDRQYYQSVANIFVARDTVSKRIYGGRNNRSFETTVVDRPIIQLMGNYCFIGLGALKYLTLNNPFIKFKFTSVKPVREKKILDEFEIPHKLQMHPKFNLPDGSPRTYFYEALEACRTNPLGTIKLPPQSGKTSILLTLAHNLRRQVGTGAIFVTSANLRKQLIRRATEEYGIDNIVTYEDYSKGKVNKTIVDKSRDWIIVLTPQLFNSRVKSKELDGNLFKWLIYDECHHISSPTGQTIFYVMQSLTRAYGFSASPTKKAIPQGNLTFNKIDYEDALRIASFGVPIYSRETAEMIELGNSNETILINYEYHWDPEELSTLEMQFNTLGKGQFQPSDYDHLLEILCLNTNRTRTISEIQSILNESGRNTMLNITRRKYGFSMLDSLQRNDTALWYGSDTVYENSQLMTKLKDFEATEFNPWKETFHEKFDNIYESKVLNTKTLNSYFGTVIRNLISTSSVGSEGVSFDIPINAAILSEGKGSNTIMVVQRSGRTAAIGEKKSIIVNIVDRSSPSVLTKHSTMRMTSLRKEYRTTNLCFDNLTDLRKYITSLQD